MALDGAWIHKYDRWQIQTHVRQGKIKLSKLLAAFRPRPPGQNNCFLCLKEFRSCANLSTRLKAGETFGFQAFLK
jgi:hypothetical protein